MKIVLILISFMSISFVACQQKNLFVNIPMFEEKELRIYYDRKEYPPLKNDNEENYHINFSSDTVYTSTKFEQVKNLRNVFCVQ